VVAVGCWSRTLVPDLAPSLTVARQGIAYVGGVPRAYRVGPFVPFGMIGDGYYGFPADGRVGLKLAFHDVEEVVEDPDFDRGTVSPTFVQRTEWFLRTVLRLPPERYPVTYASCAYNLSPGGDFLIDHHPAMPGLLIATAGSGHGFKFGSVIGRVIADRLEGVPTNGWWDSFSFQGLARQPAAVLP
jgi:glycine/D-amino acid oxidase-like deaminating enzyme